MPRCGATFDENAVPLGQDFRVVWSGCPVGVLEPVYNPLKASRPLSFRLLSLFGKENFQGGLSGTRNWDTVL